MGLSFSREIGRDDAERDAEHDSDEDLEGQVAYETVHSVIRGSVSMNNPVKDMGDEFTTRCGFSPGLVAGRLHQLAQCQKPQSRQQHATCHHGDR